jgi:hypothetical protein
MPRARTYIQDNRQTAATQTEAAVCLFIHFPYSAIILIACLITALAFNTPIVTSAASSSQTISNTSTSRLSPIFTREVQYWADTSCDGQALHPWTRTWSQLSCRSNPAGTHSRAPAPVPWDSSR